VEEVSALKKEEGDAVLVEGGRKKGAGHPACQHLQRLIHSWGGVGCWGGRRKWERVIWREMYSQKRIGDHQLTIVGRRRETIRGEEIRREMLGGGANKTPK
jgi:hypothetical protein